MAADADPELRRLVAEEHTRLVGLLALHTGDRWVAEELAQDTIVRLCQHWPRVRRMDRPGAWLTRVGLNLANSWLRRRAAERRALARTGPTPEVVDDDTVATLAVRGAVSQLPRRQRTAVVLRFYGGLSVAETSDVMGCAQGTVKALTHRAIGALRAGGLTDRNEEVPNDA